MRRARISLFQVADIGNLADAWHKAAGGKHQRPDVAGFGNKLEESLNRLSSDILKNRLPYGRYHSFVIKDPKTRAIHAACFEDRVFHHALMNVAAPVFERALVAYTYACRPGKGVHSAVRQLQRNLRRFAWFVKIDIDGYFASIRHDILLSLLMRRFKGEGIQQQWHRIIASFEHRKGTGLPIGSLTSQYFANYYLDGGDRWLAANPSVKTAIRYMDDIIWWCASRAQARETLQSYKSYLAVHRRLIVKHNAQVGRSQRGVGYCGFRVTPGTVRLSRRRQLCYRQRLKHWEQQYLQGYIDSLTLQQAYAAVHSIAQGAESLGWRRIQHGCELPLDV